MELVRGTTSGVHGQGLVLSGVTATSSGLGPGQIVASSLDLASGQRRLVRLGEAEVDDHSSAGPGSASPPSDAGPPPPTPTFTAGETTPDGVGLDHRHRGRPWFEPAGRRLHRAPGGEAELGASVAPADDLLLHRAGSEPEDLLHGDEMGTLVPISVRQVAGTYTPIPGDFDANGTTDIRWYAPGPAPDRVWWSGSRPLDRSTAGLPEL